MVGVRGGFLLALASCMVGPNFEDPAPPAVEGYTPEKLQTRTASTNVQAGASQRFNPQMDVPGKWWELFQSKPLNKLVELAIANSPDLAAAEAALINAQQLALADGGSLFPTLTGTFSAQRQKYAFQSYSGTIDGFDFSISPFYTIYEASVSVSYMLDVFGGIRRQIEADVAEIQYQQFQVEAAHLSLTTNLVNAVVQEASLRAQIQATNKIIETQRRQLNIIEGQFQLGGAAKGDVLQAKALLANTEATLPPLELQLDQQKNVIIALAGFYPSEKIAPDFSLGSLKLPRELPLSVPSNLVRQRPDVRSAEAQYWQAGALVGVAIANQLPQFQIQGNIGSDAGSIDQLFHPNTGVWSIASNTTQTIFSGGTLWRRRKAAEATYLQTAEQYRSTVVSAFQNVSDSIRAVQIDALRLKASVAAERASKASLDLAQQQYQLGAININSLLDNVTTYQQSRLITIQAQALRFADTVALFQALGGGWWNREIAAPLRKPEGLTISWVLKTEDTPPNPVPPIPPHARKQVPITPRLRDAGGR